MKAFWAKIVAYFMAVIAFFTGFFGLNKKPAEPQPEPTTVIEQTTEPVTEPTSEPTSEPTTSIYWESGTYMLKKGPQKTMNINAIHQLESVTDTIGDGYIITTEDGKVIVIDGGYQTETANFLSYLKTVTGQEQPHVDLWFLTHPHGDHCQVFYELIENQPEALTYDTVCLKFAPVGFYVGIDSEAEYLVGEYERLHLLFADKEYIPADGDRFSVGAARFTMLYTFDPSFTRCNESSLVFRMELGGKSVLFTGDIAFNAAYKMMNNPEYAPLLDCDVCKMAHHGQDAVNRDFYEVVTPEICLWPTPSWLWTNLNGTGPYTTLETRQWVEDLGVAKSVIKMDGSFVLFLNETADI